MNSAITKILVLFKIIESPTMNTLLSKKEAKDIYDSFMKCFENESQNSKQEKEQK